MVKIRQPALYLDLLTEHTDISVYLANNYPYDGQTDVPAVDSSLTDPPVDISFPIYLSVISTGSAVSFSSKTQVYVQVNDDATVHAFSGATFFDPWTAYSEYEVVATDGSNPDIHKLGLSSPTIFSSLDVIKIRVVAEAIGEGVTYALDEGYSFVVEDLTKPTLLSVATRGLKKLRVVFDDDMEQGTEDPTDSTYINAISGGIEVEPQDVGNASIVATRSTFVSTDVGKYIGIAGAENPLNNDIFRITAYVSSTEVTIDTTSVTAEFLPDDAIVTISPYRVDGVPDTSRVYPFFNPVVTAAEAISSTEIELTLHTEITQERAYNFYVTAVADTSGNVIDDAYLEFTTEALSVPEQRIVENDKFGMLAMVPPANLENDSTRDLERFLRVLDEPLQLLLFDIDRFPDIMDIDLVDASNLDALLAHLGNPFSFSTSLTEDEKRRLASVLVEIYKKKGTEEGLESAINYVLGITVDIQPARDVTGQWILGVGQLGNTSVLGPGQSYLLYSFDVEVTAPITGLTAQQRLWLVEMVEWGKPSHTHFNRLIEPGGTITGP